jgi:hypothetical protein
MGVLDDEALELFFRGRRQQRLSEVHVREDRGKRSACLQGVLRAFL